MKLRRQKHNYDCGVACLEMVADVSYEKALKFLPNLDDHYGTTKQDMYDALKKLGKHPRKARWIGASRKTYKVDRKRYEKFEFIAALHGWWSKKGEKREEHWVAWDGKKIFDPAQPQQRFICTSYIKIG